jgi:Cdc6-like AAA superfamily ATPase
MRLLHFNDDGKPSLVEFVGTNSPPPYAILSHTWGSDDQEVTYQDVRGGTGEHKGGWQKLLFCRDQAKLNGLEYSWIDTCCIDKTNSAELSEAINSMFAWYRKAQTCYVYLSDVSNNASQGVSEDARRWKPAFRNTRWFTRGWTLQELIAPSSVEFFSRKGTYLGDKQSMEVTIYEITGVPVEALRAAGIPLSHFSRDERLSWAKNRKTTREEDAAYCLLGLFNVFIPPIYGEGRDHALARLEEQIERASKGSVVPLYDDQKKALMESLRFEQIDARYTTIRNAYAKTCKWLLSNSEYRDWVDPAKLIAHHGFLWIRGKPGTGKSTLMKFALAHARKTMKECVVIAFFFNARGDDLEKSTIGTYRSLLLQLLERLPKLQCAFESLSLSSATITAEHQWSVESLKMLLEQAIQNLGGSPVVCFIDALDECDENQIRDMVTYFERIGTLSASVGTRFQVCFSSRHYPNITIPTGLNLVLEGQEGHSQDIINYVQNELKIGESKVAKKIRSDLQEKAAGVFIWVVLVVDILKQEYDRGRIHGLTRRLHDIPANLHELFRDILTRDSRNPDELILCIQWILYAKQPLSPEQLYYAVLTGVDPEAVSAWDPEEITSDAIRCFLLDASKGLTEITKSKSPKVQFIHESVRDFLLKDDGLGSIWPHLKDNFCGKSHERLKHCCITHMNLDIGTPLHDNRTLPGASLENVKALRESVAKTLPFMEYAVHNVLYHSNEAEGALISQQKFVTNFPLDRWIELDNLFEKHAVRWHTKSLSMLYLLAEYNHYGLIRSYPSASSCFEVGEERYGAPFLATIATRSLEAVRAFLQALSDDTGQKSDDLPTNLDYYHDHLRRDFVFPKHRTLIMFLADFGIEAVLALVIAKRVVDVNEKDHKGRTPLMRATLRGHTTTVKLLLGIDGVEVDARDLHGYTALLLATRYERKGPLEILLNSGIADVEAEALSGATALSLAADLDYTDIVRLLLASNKFDINAKDGRGNSMLLLATISSGEDTVKLILDDSKVDVDAKNNKGDTALMIAISHGRQSIIELLQSHASRRS